MERNAKLFRRIAAKLRLHPEVHYQGDWVQRHEHLISDGNPCGTRACIAGWALLLGAPDRFRVSDQGGNFVDIETGRHVIAANIEARELLGLSESEAYILFDAYWEPKEGETVPQALMRYAAGERINYR